MHIVHVDTTVSTLAVGQGQVGAVETDPVAPGIPDAVTRGCARCHDEVGGLDGQHPGHCPG